MGRRFLLFVLLVLTSTMLTIDAQGQQAVTTHVVQRGETFASIAAKYNITESDLRSANPNANTCFAGMKLSIKKNDTAATTIQSESKAHEVTAKPTKPEKTNVVSEDKRKKKERDAPSSGNKNNRKPILKGQWSNIEKAFIKSMNTPRAMGRGYLVEHVNGTSYLFGDNEKMYSKENVEEFCNMSDYIIINSTIIGKRPVNAQGRIYSFPDNIYFVPKDEYTQYKEELERLANDGLLAHSEYALTPRDNMSSKKGDEQYEKGIKYENSRARDKAFKCFHEGAVLGDANSKIKLAEYYLKGYGTEKNQDQSRLLIDELVFTDDPNIWFRVEKMMSQEAKSYVEWRKGKREDIPFKYLLKYKGKKYASDKLREGAESGNVKAQKELGMQLWSGENITQDKKEAVEWLKKTLDKFGRLSSDLVDVQDYLIVSKGEGFYDENIPAEWYSGHRSQFLRDEAAKGNKEAEFALAFGNYDKSSLRRGVENGDHRAAEALDQFTKNVRSEEEDVLLLLKNASKTGYDKYGEDAKLIKEIYQDAIAFIKADKKERFDNRHGFAKDFVTFYSKYPQYDKQAMLKKALILVNFNQVNDALHTLRDDPPLWNYEGRGFLGMTRTPVWDSKFENYFFGQLNDAITTCRKSTSDPTLGSYFTKSLPKLNTKLAKIKEYAKADRLKYDAAVRKFNEEQRHSSSGSSGNLSNNSNNRETEKTNSCRVHLYFKDGSVIDEETFTAGYSSWSGYEWSGDFKTDKKGFATIVWPDKYDKLNWILIPLNIGVHFEYQKDKLELKKGGNYEICLDCK